MTITFYKDDLKLHEQQVENKSNIDTLLEFNFLDYQTMLDLDTKTLTRENDEFLFFLDFNKKECTITLKQEKMDCNITVDNCSLKRDNNLIILEYTIETEDARNKLIIKE